MRFHFMLLNLFIIAITASGCAVNRADSQVMPGTDVAELKDFYVEKYIDDKHDTNQLISNRINKMGLNATTGPEGLAPEDIDVIVTYKDKWWWDITMYMLELTITFREPGTDFPIAEGNSYHSSLTRKSPEEMVDEVLTNIFEDMTNSQ